MADIPYSSNFENKRVTSSMDFMRLALSPLCMALVTHEDK
jgi:hypothetical protein